ncbi:MAG: XdhC family protein [Chloroflexota bacterium]
MPWAARRGGGADARRQVRRLGHRDGARPRLPVRRRGGQPEDPGRPPRPAAGGRRPREDLDRLRGPTGLDLGGREPAETALSIMAEVVAARFGGTGVPMRERAATG